MSAGPIVFIVGAIIAVAVVGYWLFDHLTQRRKNRHTGGRRY